MTKEQAQKKVEIAIDKIKGGRVMVKVYQISKSSGKLWWTATIKTRHPEKYKTNSDYLYTQDRYFAETCRGIDEISGADPLY